MAGNESLCRVIEALRRVTSGNGALCPARWHHTGGGWHHSLDTRHMCHACSAIAATSSYGKQTPPGPPAPSNKVVTSWHHTSKAEHVVYVIAFFSVATAKIENVLIDCIEVAT